MKLTGLWNEGSWPVEHLRNEPINAGANFGRKLKGCEAFNDLVRGEIPHLASQLRETIAANIARLKP